MYLEFGVKEVGREYLEVGSPIPETIRAKGLALSENTSTGDVNASTSVQDSFDRHTSIVCSVRSKAVIARMDEAGSAEAIDDGDVGDGRAVNASSIGVRLEG